MKTMVRYATCTALLLLLGASAGCAAKRAPEAPSPTAEPATTPAEDDLKSTAAEAELSEPATLADAEAQLEKARFNFDRLAFAAPAIPPPAAAQPGSVPEPAPAPVTESRRADSASPSTGSGAVPSPGSGDGCNTACKAYASLSRASDAVCRLDNGDGKRCERARQIQSNASRRIAACACR